MVFVRYWLISMSPLLSPKSNRHLACFCKTFIIHANIR